MALAATLLALVVTLPLGLHPASVIYGTPGDSTGTIATLWWWSYALQHGKGVLDNTMWGAPFGAGWAAQPFTVLPLLVFAPLSVLTGPTAAYSLGVLSSFPITAVVAYFAGRRLGMTTLAAAFSALAFAFLPYHQEKAMGHMLEAHMELFPAVLLFLLRWRDGGSRWNLAAAGGMLGLEVWIDYQFALILLFLTAAFFVASALVRNGPVAFFGWLGRHAAAAGVTALAVLPFLPAAILLAHRPGTGGSYAASIAGTIGQYHRTLGDIDVYSVRPLEYLMPWARNPLVPGPVQAFVTSHMHRSSITEQTQVLGYTVMVLGIAAVIWFRPRFPVVLLLLTAAVGALLALPADIHAFGLLLPGPAVLLNHVLPFIRVYARFGVLVMFAATLLAGLGFTLLEARVRALRPPWILVAPFVLLALEFNGLPPSRTTTIFPAPAEYTWLRGQPAGILIEYPVVVNGPFAEVVSRQYTLYQQVHLHPIFNGAAAGSPADQAAATVNPYYEPGAVPRLQALGIRYVFVHRRAFASLGYGVPRAVEGLRYVGTYDGGDVDAFLVQGNAGG